MVQGTSQELRCEEQQTVALKKLVDELARRVCFQAYQRWYDRTYEPKVTEV